MRKILSHPGTYLALMAALVLVMAFDLWGSQSRYLYFTTEVGLLLLIAALYCAAYQGTHWNSPAEPDDHRPRPHWRRNAALFSGIYLALAGLVVVVWAVKGAEEGLDMRQWIRMGLCFAYFAAVTLGFFLLVRHRNRYVHTQALAAATLVLVPVLVGYEAIMLAWGNAWEYNHTIIAWVLGVPLENILFLYPVCPALTMVIYSLVTRHMNDVKAFWATTALLVPAAVAVEWVAIYPLDLWRVFNHNSVLPMGKSNLEEYAYYALFLTFSLALYVWFSRNLKKP